MKTGGGKGGRMRNVLLAPLALSFLGALTVPTAFGSWAQLQEARPTPDWFTKGVMYQIQPRAFTPEGTLRAAAAKLPYLKESGFTIAYLVPVFRMDADRDRSFWSPRQIKSGFDNPKNQDRSADYFHVDEEYGTDQDLKDFCAAAHRLGMQVLFDLVYLHCGPTAPFLKEHPDFTWWNADGTVKKGPWRFPKLNFTNPKLRAYLMDNIRTLLKDFGADGFRCDVGDGIPLDFWCDAHDMMDELTGRHAILLCEGFTICDQYRGFDADYGWFPGFDARTIRSHWTEREGKVPNGARFVNHYENHDIATDARPRRETDWGHDRIDQVIVWMFTLDGVPMLFNGNEFAEASPDHSMFGRTPFDWKALETPVGQRRHALVKRLSELRRTHPALTAVNGREGLVWHDVSAPDAVTAFVRRGGGETLFVIQNWTDRPVTTTVEFTVAGGERVSYVALEDPDRSLRGTFASEPLIARETKKTGPNSFALGPYGYAVYAVKEGR